MGGFQLNLNVFLVMCLLGYVKTCDVSALNMCKSTAKAALASGSKDSACSVYNKYKACTQGLYSACSVNDKDLVEAVYLEEATKVGCEANSADLQCSTTQSTEIRKCLQSYLFSGSYDDDSQYCPWFKKVSDCAVAIIRSNCGANAADAYKVTDSYQKLTSGSIHYCPQVWNPFNGKSFGNSPTKAPPAALEAGIPSECDLASLQNCLGSFKAELNSTDYVDVLMHGYEFSADNLDFACSAYEKFTSCTNTITVDGCSNPVKQSFNHLTSLFTYSCGDGQAAFKNYSTCFQDMKNHIEYQVCVQQAQVNENTVCGIIREMTKCSSTTLSNTCGRKAGDVYKKLYTESYLFANHGDSCSNDQHSGGQNSYFQANIPEMTLLNLSFVIYLLKKFV